MAREKAVSNEQIIAAMLTSGTIAAAAESCGISPRTIYDRMKDRDFRAEYGAAKNEIIRGAVYKLNQQLSAAADTVVEIMQNPENNSAVRLQAAQTILNNAGKLADRLNQQETAARKENETAVEALLDFSW